MRTSGLLGFSLKEMEIRDVDSMASKEGVLDASRNVAAEGDCIEWKRPGYAGGGGNVFPLIGA